MHRPRKRPTYIHMNVLTWECDEHGPHRVIIAGLDDTADLAAEIVTKHPTEDGRPPTLVSELVPLHTARRAAEGGDYDDVSF